jgi:hypothetical protein
MLSDDSGAMHQLGHRSTHEGTGARAGLSPASSTGGSWLSGNGVPQKVAVPSFVPTTKLDLV